MSSPLSPSDSSAPPPVYESAGGSTPLPDTSVKIAIMGATGSGKTTFVNCASGSNLVIGESLESCTAQVQIADQFELDGRTVTLIDTPGFDDTTKSDADILKMIAFFLAATYEKGSTLAGVIYVHRISDNRFGGITGRNFNMFRKLCGDKTLENVVLATNMWGVEEEEELNLSREKELKDNFFKPALDKHAQMVRHLNTRESAHNILRKIIKNKPVVLQIQHELVDERKEFANTAAGESLSEELKELMKQHQAELEKLREEMTQSLKDKDDAMKRELDKTKKDLEEMMRKITEDTKKMTASYAAEKEKVGARVQEMEQEAKLRGKRPEPRNDGEPAFIGSLRHTATASAADRARWVEEIQKLGDNITIPVHLASNEKDQVNSTSTYLSTDRVVNVRKELLKGARPRGTFAGHVYVEVVLHGKKEGKFLEDPASYRNEMMGQVSKLVYWSHSDIDRVVQEFTGVSQSSIVKDIGDKLSSLTRSATHYQTLLSARKARDRHLSRSD